MTTTMTEKQESTDSGCVSPKNGTSVITPAVDILESEKELTIQLDVPGVAQNEIDIQFEQGMLQVVGLRNRSADRDSIRYERSFRLGDKIDATRITAAYSNGVLSIGLPKCESARQRKIEVKAD